MDQRGRLLALSVLSIALLARVAILWLRPPAPADPDNYAQIARSLAAGEGYSLAGRPTAYRPPLYPLVLLPGALLPDRSFLPWVALVNVASGLAAVALTMKAARAWGLSPERGAMAGLVVGLDPVLLGQTGSIMTEPLAAALVAAGLAATSARGPFAAGLAWGLATTCRPGLLAVGAGIAALRGLLGPGSRGDRARACALMAAGIGLALAPWGLRNALTFGRPIATTTHGGYTLALANNPVYYREILRGDPGGAWSGPGQQAWFDAMTERTLGLGEIESDRALRAEALRTIREQPGDFARACLDRIARLWGLAPSASVYPGPLRWVCVAWTLPLWIALAAGSLRCLRWPHAAAIATLAITTGVHAAFWTDMRMRAPLVPAIALAAATCPAAGEFRRFFRKQAWL